MTFNFGLFLVLVFCVYLGEVLGLIILCDNCEMLQKSRKYAFWVPFLRTGAFGAIFFECVRENKWESLKYFIACPGKNVVILCAINESIAAVLESIPKSLSEYKTKRYLLQLPCGKKRLSYFSYFNRSVELIKKAQELFACKFTIM